MNDHPNIGDNGVVSQMIIQILEEKLSRITRFEAQKAKENWSFKYIYKNLYINSNLAHQILNFSI